MFTNDVVHPMQSLAIKELLRKLSLLPFFALNSITTVPTAIMSECGAADSGEVKKPILVARFNASLEKLDVDWSVNMMLEPIVQSRTKNICAGN